MEMSLDEFEAKLIALAKLSDDERRQLWRPIFAREEARGSEAWKRPDWRLPILNSQADEFALEMYESLLDDGEIEGLYAFCIDRLQIETDSSADFQLRATLRLVLDMALAKGFRTVVRAFPGGCALLSVKDQNSMKSLNDPGVLEALADEAAGPRAEVLKAELREMVEMARLAGLSLVVQPVEAALDHGLKEAAIKRGVELTDQDRAFLAEISARVMPRYVKWLEHNPHYTEEAHKNAKDRILNEVIEEEQEEDIKAAQELLNTDREHALEWLNAVRQ